MVGLPIDKINVSTRLAMDYFEINNNLFHSMKIKDDSELQEKRLSDGYNSIIPLKSIIQPSFIEDTSESRSSIDCKLLKLKKEIEKNARTFSEIEYLIRKIPVDDVRNYDIELIIRNILFNASSGSFTFPISRNCILMEKTTPLADLGFVAQMLKRKESASAYIFADHSTAAACHLFTRLCHEVGLTSVKLVFWEERPEIAYVNTSYSQSGCVGVITENADMDSAVDVLLDSTVQYPWKLTHILIQESVYNSFKKALQWKTRNNTCMSSKKKMCTDSFNYKDKTFLLDYAGTECGQEICVEAYRTTRELLSWLSKSEYFYMSLWTNNLNESSEISHYDSAPNVIWINGYGSFDGPPESSQAVYTNILINNKMYETSKSAVPPKYDVLDNCIEISFLEKQKKWLQLSYSERFEIIYDCLCNVRNLLKDEEKELELEKCMDELKNSQIYMSVKNGRICEYSLKPIENVCARIVPYNFSTIVNGLLIGTSMIVKYNNCHLFSALDKAGAPIVFISKNLPKLPTMRLHDKAVSNYKVIYSNYGSIFAN